MKKIEIEMEIEIEKRREKVKELWNEGKIQIEIARKLGVTKGTISRDIKYLIEKGEIKSKTEERIKRLCDDFYGQLEIKKIFEKYILDCKDKFKQGTLKEEEISTIRDVVILTNKYQDIVFYLKVCTSFGQVEQAMKFVNSQIYNETFTKEEQDKMRELKEKIRHIEKEHIAMSILSKEGGVERAIKYSGLSELEVVRLNRKLLEKEEKSDKNKEENDDGEEPNI